MICVCLFGKGETRENIKHLLQQKTHVITCIHETLFGTYINTIPPTLFSKEEFDQI